MPRSKKHSKAIQKRGNPQPPALPPTNLTTLSRLPPPARAIAGTERGSTIRFPLLPTNLS
ncbi:hypothetical protein IFR04_005612, partial [Cadophora malorum]